MCDIGFQVVAALGNHRLVGNVLMYSMRHIVSDVDGYQACWAKNFGQLIMAEKLKEGK